MGAAAVGRALLHRRPAAAICRIYYRVSEEGEGTYEDEKSNSVCCVYIKKWQLSCLVSWKLESWRDAYLAAV